MIEKAKNKIQILPGGGIRKNNVKNIIKMVGCNQVHLSGFSEKVDDSAVQGQNIIHFGSPVYLPENSFQMIDPDKFLTIRKELGEI